MLVLFAYGTNTGIRHVVAGDHGHSEDDLRYVRRRFLTVEVVRSFAIEIANATFAARDPQVWGQTSTTVGSDSKHIGALESEHPDRVARPLPQAGRLDLLARGKEVDGDPLAADLMLGVRGRGDDRRRDAPRHDPDVEGNYTDTHAQSQIAFGITRLLGFELLPRIKGINRAKLYQADPGDRSLYPAPR